MDMLRFHKFTVGYAWCSDFGNPDKKEDFENIPDQCYTEKVVPIPLMKRNAQSWRHPSHDTRTIPNSSIKGHFRNDNFVISRQYCLLDFAFRNSSE